MECGFNLTDELLRLDDLHEEAPKEPRRPQKGQPTATESRPGPGHARPLSANRLQPPRKRSGRRTIQLLRPLRQAMHSGGWSRTLLHHSRPGTSRGRAAEVEVPSPDAANVHVPCRCSVKCHCSLKGDDFTQASEEVPPFAEGGDAPGQASETTPQPLETWNDPGQAEDTPPPTEAAEAEAL
jgi:hypothetical protein